ncbi:TIGR01459 family HAD-type hydrolase [Candidatus Cardinium hertigii]|jgi:HAD superfamily hydrolase (TIGR01459 family)|uniref:TIGR01459 family HAD-type hydrolase n=1 Tax=Candidatus Cardinium hertigii TaxID=247481 RepID=A0A3N2QDH2_9BACT|nr:TIGR01459 family HAD-type hydrolase [Candidatus Cardinium hertigii]ROT47603.1 TIGR01459 family HAD-type hydrolase [Candidatus Cardinium hertigii]ROT47709.1 TIGR01459 family HAD-type hydrolase [Candidatus Cardinium hertigii]
MQPLVYKHISEVINDNHYDIFLFDIWGVIIEAGQFRASVAHNITAMIECGDKVFFVTNAPRTAAFLQVTLQACGIPATKEMIVSSGEVALHMLQQSAELLGIPTPLIYHLGRANNNLIDNCSVATTRNIYEANLVLLTLFCEENEEEILAETEDILAIIAQRKILTLCANPDHGLMQADTYRYCAGYFAEKIKQQGGQVMYTGKPYPEIYQTIFHQQPTIAKNRILMIGDTFDTDIVGARTAGIDSALVLTGNARACYDFFSPLEEQLLQITAAAMEKQALPNFCIQLG